MSTTAGLVGRNRTGAPTILFLSPAAYPLGGVADWIDYLLPGLETSGMRCVLGLTTGRHHPIEPYLARHPWHDVSNISNPTGSREGRINALMKEIRKVRPDVVMVANIADAYEAVRRLRIIGGDGPRVVMTLHGLQGDLLADIAAETDVLDGVVVTNRLTQKLAADMLGSKDRVHYASYGVLPQQSIAECNARATDRMRLLYCGRLEQSQKRIFDLPLLLKRLHDSGQFAVLSIAGGGPDEVALRAEFGHLHLEASVEFLGVLSADDLAKQYCSKDALIILSSWETGPIVAWEAMSYGLPVVSSRYLGCGLENALVDGVNSLIFPVGDMDAAARAVCRLSSSNVRDQLVAGGFELIRSRYSRATSIKQWQAAIESVFAQPTLPKPEPRPHSRANGRLDRWFGEAFGERVRRLTGIVFLHCEAGGEWPHTSNTGIDETAWLSAARKADGAGTVP
jgi:glycosyltransferase involved in cell wall biosynthesis